MMQIQAIRRGFFARFLPLLLAAVLLCACARAPEPTEPPTAPTTEPVSKPVSFQDLGALGQGYEMSAAVLYCHGTAWSDTLEWLRQCVQMNLSVEAKLCTAVPSLSQYDLVYLDASLTDASEEVKQAILRYVEQGGTAVAENALYAGFPAEFLGAASFEKISDCCVELEYPEVSGDLSGLQSLLRDYTGLYPQLQGYAALASADYGWGMIPASAQPLANYRGLTALSVNAYGGGYVYFLNPMLPNRFSLGSFTMAGDGSELAGYAGATASFNQLFLSEFVSIAAKQKYGYSLSREYGYFGTPSMSWELHYEEITGIENHSMEIFSQLCEQYQQVPSFTLIRNSYTWFLRAESVTYLCNQADSGFAFEMDLNENAYSSGTHIDCDGRWLTLAEQPEGESYFTDHPEITERAYPAVVDYNHDGNPDIVCGSADGFLSYFEGEGFTDRLHVARAQKLTDETGEPLTTAGYSAPQLADVDGDGVLDLICGDNSGKVLWYRGDGSLAFEPQGCLVDLELACQALPAVGDCNADGIPDLCVGSDEGTLTVFFGQRDSDNQLLYTNQNAVNLTEQAADQALGAWLAPAFVDWNGDGITDLATGVFDGYVGIWLGDEQGDFQFADYITIDEKNYKGNNCVKFGNYCVPVFYDLDADGKLDLCCGSQEYGVAYPIDSPYFPHRQALEQQVQYAKDHHYYLGVHFYTGAFASAEREAYELEAHKRAMEDYGADLSQVGGNQHTWHTASVDGPQSMRAMYQAGLYWQSGFGAPGAIQATPHKYAENVVALPHYLVDDGAQTLLIQNCSVLTYTNEAHYALTARYRMPVCVYYHCDFVYQSDRTAHKKLNLLSEFCNTYHYNFNREDQLMLASAAAIHQRVAVSGTLAERDGLVLTGQMRTTDFDLYDAQVVQSLGVRIHPAASLRATDFAVDADIYFIDGNELVVGLNRPVRVSLPGQTAEERSHIAQINMACEISQEGDDTRLTFCSGGMMQIVVEGSAHISGEDWTVNQTDGRTVFTKYGDRESVLLHLD